MEKRRDDGRKEVRLKEKELWTEGGKQGKKDEDWKEVWLKKKKDRKKKKLSKQAKESSEELSERQR